MKKYYKSLNEILPEEPSQFGGLLEDDLQNNTQGLATGEPETIVGLLSDGSNTATSSRRDFLKWCGISFVSATVLSACENPVKKAIPYLNQPETLTPGKASWYASTYLHGNEYCPVLVKNRDGRPIKIEGNDMSSITRGGTSARIQASVLSLYDTNARYKGPHFMQQTISWDAVDATIKDILKSENGFGKRKVLVTPTLISPSTKALIEEARSFFPGLEIITWDPVSYSAIRKAHLKCFGHAVIPTYRFDKAELIVSFSADFLGTWLSPVEFACDYAKNRKLNQDNPAMSRHIHFETNLSVTGANADERIPVKPSEEKKILMALYLQLASETGLTVPESLTARNANVNFDVERLAKDMLNNKGKSLVVSGHNQTDIQAIVNGINYMLDSYGSTLDVTYTMNAGDDEPEAFEKFVDDMYNGNVATVLFYHSNPAYHYHDPRKFLDGLRKTPLTVSFASMKDETARECQYILPDHHYLESWNDAESKTGFYSLGQPLIHPLFNTRQFQDSLLSWMDREFDFHQYIKDHWEEAIFPMQSFHQGFDSFWVESLQKGIHENPETAISKPGSIKSLQFNETSVKRLNVGEYDLEFSIHANIAMADGYDANNPWLQELPDPISSVCWDNFAAIAPATANSLGLAEGEIIRLNDKIDIPVLVQPGQALDSISIALGYGRTFAGISADDRGGNAFLLSHWNDEDRLFTGGVNSWAKTGRRHVFARTQTHFSMEGRAIVRESTLDAYKEDPAAGNELHKYHVKHASSLYPETTFEGHHWALMVDLNACTGCSACVIGCQSENNTPVIGKEEVRRRRIMHWMRIDRYYNGDPNNPEVVFQPLMCQHCDHAPCENVCPVAATTHSQEGINQITYNRCVGTKYCINNCPYKVRRFNWFEYATKEKFNTHTTTDLGRMVLNPDVTVRERGVVEKCSFCVQRIQEVKLQAKNERRVLKDGEIVPACAQACPSNALVFGDLNDKNSRVAQMIKDPRNYHLLEELHTLPSVGYLTKIRNKLD
jgi:Fe-S-cluster-containing dehydrogenase component/anaerobic selenocysteine-containing dehydrogenase